MTNKSRYILPFVATLLAGTAHAHATLEQKEVAQGATSKFTVRIGHGCEGEATLKIRVAIPDGMIAIKPMPKAEWTVETIVAPYEKPYRYYDSTLTEGVREIVWTGELPDDFYDEFVFRGNVTDEVAAGTTMHVPVVQECATGNHRWIEIPAQGQDQHDLASPAPGVMVTPAVTH